MKCKDLFYDTEDDVFSFSTAIKLNVG